jgi:hypothetical protein
MSEIYTLTKQISRSNYRTDKEFYAKIKMVVEDHFENYSFQHQELKEVFRQNELLDIIMFDIANFWESSIELNFDIVDYKTPQELITSVEQTVKKMEENSRGKGLNIVVKLNTYLLPFVSFSFG